MNSKNQNDEPQFVDAIITTWRVGLWKWNGTVIFMGQTKHIQKKQPTQARARAACIKLALYMGARVKE